MSQEDELDDKPEKERARGERINKTNVKREIAKLHEMAKQLLKLKATELAIFDLDETLLQAMSAWKKMKRQSSAQKRQLKYIVGLLRRHELSLVEATLTQYQRQRDTKTVEFHALERWRKRLLTEGRPALTAYLNECPQADSQKLRQLISKAKREMEQEKDLGAARALFRYLRDCRAY